MSEKTNFDDYTSNEENSQVDVIEYYIDDNKKSNNEFIRWFNDLIPNLKRTFHKRNPVVNAILSLGFIATLFISSLLIPGTFISIWSLGIGETFYLLYFIYNMCQFVINNQKEAFYHTMLSGFAAGVVPAMSFVALTTPDPRVYEENYDVLSDDINLLVSGIVISLFFNLFAALIVWLIMKFKKYGATAWQLLDVSHKWFRTKFDIVAFYLFFVVWLIPFGHSIYASYPQYFPSEKYPTHETAKIGDYYYPDGTVSSELFTDQKPVGIVISLETTENEKNMGYTHGQIVALTDLDSNKMQWDYSDIKDYKLYPDYNWENRTDALKDCNGYKYHNCEGSTCLDMNYKCLDYLKDEVKGISNWYVPTAGQWTKILKNVGKVNVDNMLRFDAETASRNLKKININPKQWYWTITEFDEGNAWSIRPASGEFGTRTPKQNKAYIRPVAAF